MAQSFSTDMKEACVMVPSKSAKGCEKKKFAALIVDDCKTIRRIHKMLLGPFQMDVYAVENGKEAVDLCSSGAFFDLILMDNDMPIMDGPQATRLLRAIGVRSKIIGVTSRSEEREKQLFIEAGLDEYYEKPLTRTNLDAIVKKIKENN